MAKSSLRTYLENTGNNVISRSVVKGTQNIKGIHTVPPDF